MRTFFISKNLRFSIYVQKENGYEKEGYKWGAKMKRLILLMAVAMMVSLALNSFAADTYEIGMSIQEVTEQLGQPASKHIHGAYERWEYKSQDDVTEVLYFYYGRLVQMTRWATDSEGRKLHVIDILSITYKKCSVWHILPSTPSPLTS